MINKLDNVEMIQRLDAYKKALAEKKQSLKENPNGNTRRIDEIAVQSLQLEIDKLDAKIRPDDHATKIAGLDESIQKWDEKIAGMKQINESAKVFEEPVVTEPVVKEIITDETKDVSDLDIPIVPVHKIRPSNAEKIPPKPAMQQPVIASPPLRKPPPSTPSTPSTPPSSLPKENILINVLVPQRKPDAKPSSRPIKGENNSVISVSAKPPPIASAKPPPNVLVKPHISPTVPSPIQSVSDTKIASEFSEPEDELSAELEKTEVMSSVHLAEELKQLIGDSDALDDGEASEDTNTNDPSNEILTPLKDQAVKEENPPDQNIPNSDAAVFEPGPSFTDNIAKIFHEKHYQIFHFKPENRVLCQNLQNFDFIALQTRTNLPFYKDVYMDLVFVKVIADDYHLVLEGNIDAIHFERENEREKERASEKSINSPSAKALVLEPLAAYLSLSDAFQHPPTLASNSENLFIALAKLLNVEYRGNHWIFKGKYVHFHWKFLTIVKQPVYFMHNRTPVGIKNFAGFMDIQAFYLTEPELLRFLEYTKTKYQALFDYNRKNVDAQIPANITMQGLKYKMLFNAITGGILIATTGIVMLTTNPWVYWILFDAIVGLVGGLFCALKVWEFKNRMKIHTQFTHHTWAAFTPTEVSALMSEMPSDTFRTMLEDEIQVMQKIGKSDIFGRLRKGLTLAHASPKMVKKKAEIPPLTPPKVQVLNKSKLIQDFLSE